MPEEISEAKNPFNSIPAESREKTREEMVKLYFDQAFQFIVDAEYHMTFVPAKQKELETKTGELNQLLADVKAIEESPEHHTRQNRDLVKFKKEQIKELEGVTKALQKDLELRPEGLASAYKRAEEHIAKGLFIKNYGV